MSNQLAMDKAQSIKHLHSLGWSQRRIAKALGVDRKSVRRYLGLEDPKGTAPKGAKAPTGQEQLESLSEHSASTKCESSVRIFNDAWQQIALHARVEEGKYSTHGAHIASEKINNIERGVAFLLKKVQIIGPHASQWAERMLELRDIRGARVLQGLLALTRKYSSARIERACEAAWRSQGFRLRDVRSLIDSAEPAQATLDFIDQHPIIRSPEEYGQFVHDVIQGTV